MTARKCKQDFLNSKTIDIFMCVFAKKKKEVFLGGSFFHNKTWGKIWYFGLHIIFCSFFKRNLFRCVLKIFSQPEEEKKLGRCFFHRILSLISRGNVPVFPASCHCDMQAHLFWRNVHYGQFHIEGAQYYRETPPWMIS